MTEKLLFTRRIPTLRT